MSVFCQFVDFQLNIGFVKFIFSNHKKYSEHVLKLIGQYINLLHTDRLPLHICLYFYHPKEHFRNQELVLDLRCRLAHRNHLKVEQSILYCSFCQSRHYVTTELLWSNLIIARYQLEKEH